MVVVNPDYVTCPKGHQYMGNVFPECPVCKNEKQEECELAVKAAEMVMKDKCGTENDFQGVMERHRKGPKSGSPCYDLIHAIQSHIYEHMGPAEYKAGYSHFETVETRIIDATPISGGEDPTRRDGTQCRAKFGWILIPLEGTTGQPRLLEDALKAALNSINNEKDRIVARFLSDGIHYHEYQLLNIRITKINIENYIIKDGIPAETTINYKNGKTIYVGLTLEAMYQRRGY